MHAVRRAPHLVGQGLGSHRQGIGIGHLEDAGDAAHDGGAAAGLQILLVLGTWLAQMHLAVDHAGQDMQAGTVDHLARLRGCELPDADDSPARYRDIALAHPVVVHHRAISEDQLCCQCHRAFLETPVPPS